MSSALTLFNDWSARDIQAWEYQPLGPFLSKNFASTLSPWIVTLEALAPFRSAFARAAGDPQPLPYLDSRGQPRARCHRHRARSLAADRARCARPGRRGDRISRSNFAEAAYWTVAQLVAHHTVNGCSLSSGDLFGSGTLSGPAARAGRLAAGAEPGRQAADHAVQRRAAQLPAKTATRSSLRGHCRRDGFRRIGFGECSGTVLPARHRRRSRHDPQARPRRAARTADGAAAVALRRDARRDPRASSSSPTSRRPSPS